MFAKTALAAVLLAAGGCGALAPRNAADMRGPVQVPAGWSSSQGVPALQADALALSLQQWGAQFDDPLLLVIIRRALLGNRSLALARASVLQARALRDVAAAALRPGLVASGALQTGSVAGQGSGLSSQVQLGASWAPDVFGALHYAFQASSADVAASALGLEVVGETLASETALAYVQLRGTQSRLLIARRNLDSQLETLQLTTWRQQAGLVTALEVAQARAASEQTRAQLPLLQIGIDQTLHALAVLMAAPLPADLQLQLQAFAAVPVYRDVTRLPLPLDVLARRTDVRAAQFQVEAAWARVAQADAARKPGFSLSGSIALQAVSLGSLVNSATFVTGALAGISLPLLDGGALRARVRLQEAAYEQSRVAYQATLLAVLQQVEDALVGLQGDQARRISLSLAADAATEAATLARQRYASGLVDFQVVLETQRTLYASQDGLALAQTAVSADQVRLFKALGGAVPLPEPLVQVTR